MPSATPTNTSTITMNGNSHNHSHETRSSSPMLINGSPKQYSVSLQKLHHLWHPAPTSFVLSTVLRLLPELMEGQTVYLMDPVYLERWLHWCGRQIVPANEVTRLREATRLALFKYGFSQSTPVTWSSPDPNNETNPNITDQDDDGPGPIDNSYLSLPGHPLLLDLSATIAKKDDFYTSLAQQTSPVTRVQSAINVVAPRKIDRSLQRNGALDRSFNKMTMETKQEPKISDKLCVAVPESFYEALRGVHGVLCDDMETISFQKDNETNIILHHHQHHSKLNHTAPSPRPIEFRRKVILRFRKIERNPTNLLEKLMLEETTIPDLFVEVHPMKLLYTVMSENGSSSVSNHFNSNNKGFVLVSADTLAIEALSALQRVAEPSKVISSIRLWSRWHYDFNNMKSAPTASFDGYEFIDFEFLTETPPLTVAEWIRKHFAPTDEENIPKELDILVETRKTVNSAWPRDRAILSERLQPGDFVDAQDVAGKWYEAWVREVHDEFVLVHYSGWASKWDGKCRRRNTVSQTPKGVQSKVKAPAPLWSRSGRWREQLKVGDFIEVRDSSSLISRPKWYRGQIKAVGQPNDPPRDMKGGADLESYPMVFKQSEAEYGGIDQYEPLLIMGLKQQILVQVEQEKSDKASISQTNSSSPTSQQTLKPNPPFLRWVNLYGEEICKLGTHLKEANASAPVTLRYELDGDRKPVEILKSHPMHGSGFMRESLRGTPPAPGSVGLHNLGNSCFLNSTVQCLNHIEPLTQYFVQDKYMKELNKENPLGSGGNVAIAYASLLKKIWAGNHSVLVPRTLKQTVASFAPQFDNSYQHDSHEFCQFLMDGLHEDLNRVKKKPYVEDLEGFGLKDEIAAIESWRKHLLRHDSVIVDHCQGMHRSHLTCPQCGRESIKFDVYSSISLPLPMEKQKATIKLEDCIEKFMEAEQLDERDAYYCPSCRKHVCALKLIALWSVPDILIIHLKRFTFDKCLLSGSMLRSKIDHTVEFPVNGLDLTKDVLGPIDPEAPPIYNLFGISEHIGPTANSGHYTATVRNSIDGQWYRCNDSHVGLTSGEASITGGAYLLFYQRAKGRSKWAGMHRVMKERGVDPYDGMNPIFDKDGFTQVKKKKNR